MFLRKLLIIFLLIFSLFTIFSIVKLDDNVIKNESNARASLPPIVKKVVRVGNHVKTSFVTISTIYFKLPQSTHPAEFFNKFIQKFLRSVSNTPVAIFTDSISFSDLHNATLEAKRFNRMSNLTITIFVIDDIWSYTSQLSRMRNMNYEDNYRNKQPLLHERKLNPMVYAVWNSKPFFLNLTAQINEFNSKFFIYTDIGAFRWNFHIDWPDQRFVRLLSAHLNDRILIGQVRPKLLKKAGRLTSEIFIQAGFFAGSAKAVRHFSDAFYRLHDVMLRSNEYGGEEQKTLNLMTLDESYKQNIVALKAYSTETNCSDNRLKYYEWYAYQLYFANHEFTYCMNHEFKLSNSLLRTF